MIMTETFLFLKPAYKINEIIKLRTNIQQIADHCSYSYIAIEIQETE